MLDYENYVKRLTPKSVFIICFFSFFVISLLLGYAADLNLVLWVLESLLASLTFSILLAYQKKKKNLKVSLESNYGAISGYVIGFIGFILLTFGLIVILELPGIFLTDFSILLSNGLCGGYYFGFIGFIVGFIILASSILYTTETFDLFKRFLTHFASFSIPFCIGYGLSLLIYFFPQPVQLFIPGSFGPLILIVPGVLGVILLIYSYKLLLFFIYDEVLENVDDRRSDYVYGPLTSIGFSTLGLLIASLVINIVANFYLEPFFLHLSGAITVAIILFIGLILLKVKYNLHIQTIVSFFAALFGICINFAFLFMKNVPMIADIAPNFNIPQELLLLPSEEFISISMTIVFVTLLTIAFIGSILIFGYGLLTDKTSHNTGLIGGSIGFLIAFIVGFILTIIGVFGDYLMFELAFSLLNASLGSLMIVIVVFIIYIILAIGYAASTKESDFIQNHVRIFILIMIAFAIFMGIVSLFLPELGNGLGQLGTDLYIAVVSALIQASPYVISVSGLIAEIVGLSFIAAFICSYTALISTGFIYFRSYIGIRKQIQSSVSTTEEEAEEETDKSYFYGPLTK